MHPKNKLISLMKIGLLAASILFFTTEANAEYYLVYPQSEPMPSCYSCSTHRTYYHPHHHYQHHRYVRHRTKNSVSVSVYYLAPPCGCSACDYSYQPCHGCSAMNTIEETPCPDGHCYVNTDDNEDTFDMDTHTADDVTPDMEINDN